MEQVCVGARDQSLETFGGFGFGQAERDRMRRIGSRKYCRDLLEPCQGFGHAEVRHRTDELVTAVADDHVVRAHVRAERLTEELQQGVTGQMALAVVDLFKAVDVDEREYERGSGPMCAFELAGHLLETEPARPPTRQFIGGSELQVVCSFRPVPEPLSAFMGCFLPVGGRPGTVIGCFGSIGRRSRPVPPRARQDVLPSRVLVVLHIVQTSELIPAGRATITKRSIPIALLRRFQPRRGTLLAYG